MEQCKVSRNLRRPGNPLYYPLVPYELSFTKPLVVADPSIYINECCWGGDIVRDKLLPAISNKYAEVFTNQEDWGWFIWFRQGPIHLAVDIFCDDPQRGEFRIRLSTGYKRWFIIRTEVDGAELESLRDLVSAEVSLWAGNCNLEKVK
jgi:hypothetical protein